MIITYHYYSLNIYLYIFLIIYLCPLWTSDSDFTTVSTCYVVCVWYAKCIANNFDCLDIEWIGFENDVN